MALQKRFKARCKVQREVTAYVQRSLLPSHKDPDGTLNEDSFASLGSARICLSKDFVPEQYDNEVMQEAADLITHKHIPSAAEKCEMHEAVKSLLSKPLPGWFIFEPEKLFHRIKSFPESSTTRLGKP